MQTEFQISLNSKNISERMVRQYIFEEEQEHRDDAGELNLTSLAEAVEMHFDLYGEDESQMIEGLFDAVTTYCMQLKLI